ncbi:MAG: sugar ABC transporter ATP-binding protein [Phycisphaerales bacterium]|nr:sugar ABC transporter ATP-binding protein [Phycisphaerales bacterium]
MPWLDASCVRFLAAAALRAYLHIVPEPILSINGVTKDYPAVRAVNDLSLTINRGEAHGVIGENGAGKSTLMKMLSGLERPTAGSITFEGRPLELRSAADAMKRGIAMIHQELNLIGELSVADNIFLGRERTTLGLVDRGSAETAALKLLNQLGSNVSPRTRVNRLSIADQQLVEIAKALSCEARLLIMDEPTAVLSERETNALFRVVNQLRLHRGVTIIYISHILPEVRRLCDRITVLRDGQYVKTVEPREVDDAALARLMVGRDLGELFPQRAAHLPDTVLEVRNFFVDGWVRGAGFELHRGEILGLAGLVGSGRTEFAEAIAGVRRRRSGSVSIIGEPANIRRPVDAIAHRLAYVSEDRKLRGLHLDLSITENTTLANLRAYGTPLLKASARRASAVEHARRLGTRCATVRQRVSSLSGGNQQKVALAKWLDTKPNVLILDEPTRGVDIGAKQEIYGHIHQLAAEGRSIVMISSEMPELIGLCHRILVMRNGRIVGALPGDKATEADIMHLAAGLRENRVA